MSGRKVTREEFDRLSDLVSELLERIEEIEHPTGAPPLPRNERQDRPAKRARMRVSHR